VFKKVEGNRTISTEAVESRRICAARTSAWLEEVKIHCVWEEWVIERYVSHTQSSAAYRNRGSIQCGGEVKFELQSSDDRRERPRIPGAPEQHSHPTRLVTFELATVRAQTVPSVEISLPNGVRRWSWGRSNQSEQASCWC